MASATSYPPIVPDPFDMGIHTPANLNRGARTALLQNSPAVVNGSVGVPPANGRTAQTPSSPLNAISTAAATEGAQIAHPDFSPDPTSTAVQQPERLSKERMRLNDLHNTIRAQLDDERAKFNGFEDELRSLDNAARSKKAQIVEEGLQVQQLAHRVEKLHKERQRVTNDLRQMDVEYDWILDEKDKFGLTGTLYDFHSQNIGECKVKLRTLAECLHRLKKNINPKVMNMMESVEKKEAALKRMMKTVIRDKKKIEETIVSLDDYKKRALQETWEKVSRDCGQIFSELLPGGNTAQLDPPEGKTIDDGLEFKVCLGTVWKTNLLELSGGQRSLIALSLILALLEFKPAPVYILDEVDATLDPAHKQNIGHLIKRRFKGSQFIVVSLKDGMFQNANTIFRTRFSEGTSVVQTFTPANYE